MTLYIETSAVLGVYLREPRANFVLAAVQSDPIAYTCGITYLETRAGFARALRDRRIDQANYLRLKATFEIDWAKYLYVPVDAILISSASDLAERHSGHALRAFDALQLAAAVRAATVVPGILTVLCFDRRLWRSARDEGFDLLPRSEP